MDLETRTLYLGDIDDDNAAIFMKQMHILESVNDFPITVIINSRGGDWSDGLAIYDTILDSDAPVYCEVRGKCMSMAVIIAQACDMRWVMPHATVMVHNGSAGADGDAQNFEAWARYSKRERMRMYEILAKRTGQTAEYWKRKVSKCDLILTAREAVDHGLFDEVCKPND